MKHSWEDYELAADICPATAERIAKAVEWDGMTLPDAIQAANVGLLADAT